MTIVLTESDVEALIDMKEVVASVEEVFRRHASGEVHNTRRTRSRGVSSVLNVMHANLDYLNRGGVKAYMSTRAGTRFLFALFDSSNSAPLALMEADTLGRYRTGAASGVATRHLYGKPSATVAIFGSGRQAITQVQALGAVLSIEGVKVWSPVEGHRMAFTERLKAQGYNAHSAESPRSALEGVQVATSITSSRAPFIDESMVAAVSHFNVCGGNVPEHSELTPRAVGSFGTVAVDYLPQAKEEYGDLILAAKAGGFRWESAVPLEDVVSGKKKPAGRTLFKSGGVAMEDVAVASLLYDKALSASRYRELELP